MIPLFCGQNDLYFSLPARTVNKPGLNVINHTIYLIRLSINVDDFNRCL